MADTNFFMNSLPNRIDTSSIDEAMFLIKLPIKKFAVHYNLPNWHKTTCAFRVSGCKFIQKDHIKKIYLMDSALSMQKNYIIIEQPLLSGSYLKAQVA